MSVFIPVAIAFGIAFYSWSIRRIRRAAQPLRLQLAEKGERLLGDPNLPEPLSIYVKFLLESAFSSRLTLIAGLFYIPVMAYQIAFNTKSILKVIASFKIKNSDTAIAFEDVGRLHSRIVFANHPFLRLAIELEALVLLPLAILVLALVRGVFTTEPRTESTMVLITSREAKFFAHHHGWFTRPASS